MCFTYRIAGPDAEDLIVYGTCVRTYSSRVPVCSAGPDAEGLVAMMDELLGAEHTAPLDDEADDTGVYGGVYGGGYASQLQNFRGTRQNTLSPHLCLTLHSERQRSSVLVAA